MTACLICFQACHLSLAMPFRAQEPCKIPSSPPVGHLGDVPKITISAPLPAPPRAPHFLEFKCSYGNTYPHHILPNLFSFSLSHSVSLPFLLPPSPPSFPSFFLFFFFFFLPPQSIWSFQARDQIQAAVVTYTTAMAMLC